MVVKSSMVTVKYISVIGHFNEAGNVDYIVLHGGNLFAGKTRIFVGEIRDCFSKHEKGIPIWKDNIRQLDLIVLPKPMGRHQLAAYIEEQDIRGEFDHYFDRKVGDKYGIRK